MKKYLVYSVVALALASCSNEVLIDEIKEDAKEIAVAFETYSQPVTKAAENSTAEFSWVFYNHHESFQVWGYKNTSTDKVFSGDVVTVSVKDNAVKYTQEEIDAAIAIVKADGYEQGSNTNAELIASKTTNDVKTPATYNYVYSPLRFWDKAATTYQYYAAAPKDADWVFVSTAITDATNQDKGYFTTTATISDHTLTASEYTQSFKSIATTQAIDKMIASPCAVNKSAFSQTVQLHFNHILSRLNITVKKSDVEPIKSKTVTLKNLQVARLYGNGNFSEATAAVSTGSNSRWSLQSNPIVYTAVKDVVVTTAEQYVLQSLVVPQNAAYQGTIKLDGSNVAETTAPYLVITYSIKDGTYEEEFTSYYDLANLFAASPLPFNEGWQNTLKITISPDVIEFCADVAEWATTIEKSVELK